MPKPLMLLAATAVALVLGVSVAHALTPEQLCQKGRYDAAAKYAQCEDKAIGKLFASNDLTTLQPALSKCRVKYTGTWLRLQLKALGTGSTCDNPRFADNGGTVTDRLTGLEWEKKTGDGMVHDKDDMYTWLTANEYFLTGNDPFHGLNKFDSNYICFVDNECNWRLPTRAELQTILLEPFACTTSPCTATIFGTSVASYYWTSTTLADNSNYAWFVRFDDGTVGYDQKISSNHVRAVRGGL
ncbi:MAG TPA: DUF1566 domain-containing protein [Candidatus Binatia bacterium]|nr:DUF1566 domain-containing protein [Candidatus Binatia bacterium]